MRTKPQADALPRKKRALRGRRLVVVDIENVVGGAVLTRLSASWAQKQIKEAIRLRHDEQVIVVPAMLASCRRTWHGQGCA